MTRPPTWKAYEKQIADGIRERAAPDATIEFDSGGNLTLSGLLSGVPRQVDVLVRGTFTGNPGETKMVVECKCWRKRVDLPAVEAFGGFLDDVSVGLGLMITTVGYTDAAKRRAGTIRGVQVHVIPFDALGLWLPLKPSVAMTAGATTATVTYRDEGRLITEIVSPEVAKALIAAYNREPASPNS